MDLGTRVKRGGITLQDWALHGTVRFGQGVKVAGQWGGRTVRDAFRWVVRRFERPEEKRPEHMPVAGFPMARFDVYGDFHFLQPSEAKHSFRRELARSHAQLVEQLRVEEEELSRVAARVVRLQSLLRAQQSLLLETTRGTEAARASLNAPFQPLVGVGMGSGREGEHPDLFRPN